METTDDSSERKDMMDAEELSTEDEEEEQRVVEEDKVKVRWNSRHNAEKPVRAFCELCGLWLGLILLLALFSVTVGSIKFEIEVPFYDRAEINQERQDAYRAAERDADYVSNYGQAESGACIHEDPTILTRNGTLLQGPAPTKACQRVSNNFLRLIYIVKDRQTNILNQENLREIQKIEDHILNTLEITRYCLLLDSKYPAFLTRDPSKIATTILETADEEPNFVACERINSPLNFLDPLYFDRQNESGTGYHLLPNDQVPQEYDFSALSNVISYWKDFNIRSYNLSDYDFLAATIGKSVTIQNPFWSVTSSDFTLGSTEAIGLTSTYSLGFPINGYTSSTTDKEDQWTDTGDFLWNEFDSFLKSANFDGVEVYWSDSESAMRNAEESELAMKSFAFFPASLCMVLLYLIYMQDSFFIAFMGMAQIMLTFVPSLIFYRYVLAQKYFGVLNLISIFIILGIGVANLFVFSDQYHHFRLEKDFAARIQKVFNVAAKATFATSCTTCISFVSNATSVFPAVSSFGIFSAVLIVMNYIAVISFFPAVISIYHKKIRERWWDHPSLLFRCKKEVPSETEEDRNHPGQIKEENSLVRFFRDWWAPMVIKFRFVILLLFTVVFAVALYGTMQLEPEEEVPTTLPDGNNYKEYPDIIIDYFARAGNPRDIEVRWVSGIDIDNPVDRSGTDRTDIEDYGKANYADCASYNPTTPAAQVWSLESCHDLFFGNVTQFHDGDMSFSLDGLNGPKARYMITDVVALNEYNYYTRVSCPIQGFRDWMLTDRGCESLQNLGLPCMEETSLRENCTLWDSNGNSCEPFPIPAANFLDAFDAFLEDSTVDPVNMNTNFDKFSNQIFVDDDVTLGDLDGDFSCRTYPDGRVLFAISTIATLDKDFAQNYEAGIDLYTKWDTWSRQVRSHSPTEMLASMQTDSGAWAFYYLSDTLLGETFSGIGLALGLSMVVLVLVTGNYIMAFYAVFTIGLIVVDVFAFTVWAGWALGVVEAVIYVVVVGMSIDYTVHMGNAYTASSGSTRQERVTKTFEKIAVSVLSSAISTLLAMFLMFFAPNLFFVKFASFLFVTISLSCIYSTTFFPAMLCLIGPMGHVGDIYPWIRKLRAMFGGGEGEKLQENSERFPDNP